MRRYNLGFVSDEDIFNHVRETVQRYSANIDLKEFNKNIVDPIKLTFDAKVYGRTVEEVVAYKNFVHTSSIKGLPIIH